jgi:hypothetical protein
MSDVSRILEAVTHVTHLCVLVQIWRILRLFGFNFSWKMANDEMAMSEPPSPEVGVLVTALVLPVDHRFRFALSALVFRLVSWNMPPQHE